jgi:hypothetical protein
LAIAEASSVGKELKVFLIENWALSARVKVDNKRRIHVFIERALMVKGK